MDLQLTKRGDYTLRAAISLARNADTGTYRKLREVADEMAIPARYTHEIVTLLVKAGLAEALAGKQGGYRLTRAPGSISLLEVVEAGDGAMRMGRCALSGGPCHWQETICAVHPVLEESARAMTATLAGRTLADVLELDQRLEARSRQRQRSRGRA
jgi:Rrf2 family protein